MKKAVEEAKRGPFFDFANFEKFRYNIIGFDIGYLVDRAEALGLTGEQFGVLGRVKGSATRVKEVTLNNGKNTKDILMEGRIIFDMLNVRNFY